MRRETFYDQVLRRVPVLTADEEHELTRRHAARRDPKNANRNRVSADGLCPAALVAGDLKDPLKAISGSFINDDNVGPWRTAPAPERAPST